jgi:hypothetical protein
VLIDSTAINTAYTDPKIIGKVLCCVTQIDILAEVILCSVVLSTTLAANKATLKQAGRFYLLICAIIYRNNISI